MMIIALLLKFLVKFLLYLNVDVEDICCIQQEMFVLQSGGNLTRFSLITPKECAAKLFVLGNWLQCSKVRVVFFLKF